MIYLDNAATTRFKPERVIKALIEETRHGANPGRSGHKAAAESALKVYRARENIKDFFNAPNHEVIMTKNCTEALNLAIFGAVRQGGHVITTAYEHNSVLRPLYKLYSEKKIKLTVISPDKGGNISPRCIASKFTRDTVMVITTHVSNVTGKMLDIGETGRLCAKAGILYVVDASQSAGHVDIDVPKANVDILCAPGHKGLHGVQGTGFLLTHERILLNPLLFGGTGTASDNVYQPKDLPESLESGTLNTPGIAALDEAVSFCRKNRTFITKTVRNRTEELLYGLKNLKNVIIYTPPTEYNGVVSFNVDGLTSTETADRLNVRDVAVRAGLHCAPLAHNYLKTLDIGAVRASVAADTSAKDVRIFLSALEKIIKSLD